MFEPFARADQRRWGELSCGGCCWTGGTSRWSGGYGDAAAFRLGSEERGLGHAVGITTTTTAQPEATRPHTPPYAGRGPRPQPAYPEPAQTVKEAGHRGRQAGRPAGAAAGRLPPGRRPQRRQAHVLTLRATAHPARRTRNPQEHRWAALGRRAPLPGDEAGPWCRPLRGRHLARPAPPRHPRLRRALPQDHRPYARPAKTPSSSPERQQLLKCERPVPNPQSGWQRHRPTKDPREEDSALLVIDGPVEVARKAVSRGVPATWSIPYGHAQDRCAGAARYWSDATGRVGGRSASRSKR